MKTLLITLLALYGVAAYAGPTLNPCYEITKVTMGGPNGMVTELKRIPGCVDAPRYQQASAQSRNALAETIIIEELNSAMYGTPRKYTDAQRKWADEVINQELEAILKKK